MAWVLLGIAGLLEVAWSAGLKLLGTKYSVALLVLTVVALVASMGALYASMSRLPLGVAYPIWTGIGSVGSVVVSVMLFGQTVGWPGMLGVVLLLAGMALIGFDTL